MRFTCCFLLAIASSAASIEGVWTLRQRPHRNDYHLTLRRNILVDSERTVAVSLHQLKNLSHAHLLLPAPVAVQFTLARDAGTVSFHGTAVNGAGSGRFAFQPDPAFVSELGGIAVDPWNHDKIYDMAVAGVPLSYLRGLGAVRNARLYSYDVLRFYSFGRPAHRELFPVTPHPHTVDPGYWQRVRETGYPLFREDIERLQTYGVSPDLLRQMKISGYDVLPVSDAIKLQTHGVTQFDIQSMEARGHKNLSTDEIVRYKVNGIP